MLSSKFRYFTSTLFSSIAISILCCIFCNQFLFSDVVLDEDLAKLENTKNLATGVIEIAKSKKDFKPTNLSDVIFANLRYSLPASLTQKDLLLEFLQNQGAFAQQGKDDAIRPLFLTTQAQFEKLTTSLLQHGVLKKAVVIIHTPLPPTPFRFSPDVKTPALQSAHPELVTRRQQTLVDLLNVEGTVMAVYSSSASTTDPEGYVRYKKYVTQYTNLIDLPIDKVPPSLSGATYLLTDCFNNHFVFWIKTSQATKAATSDNKEQEVHFSIGLGWANTPAILLSLIELNEFLLSKNINVVDAFLKDNKEPLFH